MRKENNSEKKMFTSHTGKGSIKINAFALAGGAYNYSLYVDGNLVDTKQMMLVK